LRCCARCFYQLDTESGCRLCVLRHRATRGNRRRLEIESKGSAQVSAKAQLVTKLMVRWIDSFGGWRYSQAQIPDLVAHANPRFHLRAPSFGSVLLHGGRFLEKTIEICVSRASGAKARVDFGGVARGLKPPSPSGLISCAGAKQDAENRKPGKKSRVRPSGAKARHLFWCIYGTTEVVPFQRSGTQFNSSYPRRTDSTRQRRPGGSRFL
jgi:hypothetical protein